MFMNLKEIKREYLSNVQQGKQSNNCPTVSMITLKQFLELVMREGRSLILAFSFAC
jgi:hypothetical protein